ncbi:hypothetical protein HX052_09685, partial [Myroides marinus]|nr:hypothetical protein [Myroides marinus]MDM1366955.1 hypothetical protein [Myroides marinus]MDM1372888.1 hypothetical protein [Myroides marinus]MDM1374873.1 hypothetical protein [Myroides marinus]MDM1380223.1 hypothetical protein [Myroides marinus]
IGGVGAVLADTELKVKAGGIADTHLAVDAVTTTKIADKNVTSAKIAGGTDGQVLVSDATGAAKWVNQTAIVPASKTVIVDNSIELIGGVGAVLADTELKVKAGGIADTHLAVGAVTETKILDSAVTTLKIKDEAVTLGKLAKGEEADLVLTTGAGGVPTWTKKDLIATKKDLTTDGVIVIGDASSTVTSLVGAVMQPTTLSLKNNSVVVDKLAIISGKNQHIVTDETGKPKWESKAVNVTSTATLLNEAIDGKKVYSITIPTAAVIAPTTNTGLTYNSEMTVPIAADFDYLLSVHIFDKNKKLVMSSVTDGTATGGKLTFRFGGNGMYLTLPVAADYRVVLKYASKDSYVN